MDVILENKELKCLNLANNAILDGPKPGRDENNSQKHSRKFMDKLVTLIKQSESLQHLDVSNMNLRERTELLIWPIYHSNSL